MPVAFRSAVSSTGLSPGSPAGVALDDIVLAIYSGEGIPTTVTPATGAGGTFTRIGLDTDIGGVLCHETFWLRKNASAVPNNWADGGDGGRICLLCYSGCKTSGSPVNTFAVAESTDGSTETSITTTVANCMIVAMLNQWSWGTTSSSDLANERIDQGEAISCYDDGLLVSAGSTGTLTIIDNGIAAMTLLALEPDGGAPPAASFPFRQHPPTNLIYR